MTREVWWPAHKQRETGAELWGSFHSSCFGSPVGLGVGGGGLLSIGKQHKAATEDFRCCWGRSRSRMWDHVFSNTFVFLPKERHGGSLGLWEAVIRMGACCSQCGHQTEPLGQLWLELWKGWWVMKKLGGWQMGQQVVSGEVSPYISPWFSMRLQWVNLLKTDSWTSLPEILNQEMWVGSLKLYF